MASFAHGRFSIRPSQSHAASGLLTALEDGLGKAARETVALLKQLICEIEAKMTAAVQVTGTDAAVRL